MSFSTLITVHIPDGDFLEWMDKDLPTPTHLFPVENYSASYWNDKDDRTAYKITYAIDGYFGTTKGKKYLYDVASRLAYALNGTYEIIQNRIKSQYIYNLSRFDHLERIPSFKMDTVSNAWNGKRNEIFNAMRHEAYQMHKSNTLNLEALTIYGNQISNNSEHVKYLAKNIFQWVETNYTGRQSTMTRKESAINASKIKAEKAKQKVFSLLKYKSLFSFDSLSYASKISKVSRVTFKKYLGEYTNLERALKVFLSSQTPYVQPVYTGIGNIKRILEKVTHWMTQDAILEDFLSMGSLSPPKTDYRDRNPAPKKRYQIL